MMVLVCDRVRPLLCSNQFFFSSEPVDKVAALREFRVLHTALHSSSSYREAVSVPRPCLRFVPGLAERV